MVLGGYSGACGPHHSHSHGASALSPEPPACEFWPMYPLIDLRPQTISRKELCVIRSGIQGTQVRTRAASP